MPGLRSDVNPILKTEHVKQLLTKQMTWMKNSYSNNLPIKCKTNSRNIGKTCHHKYNHLIMINRVVKPDISI